jgi:enoyl-[acyl-carrier protein] reductase I
MFDLNGKRGLVVGIANDKSIAWGCARAFSRAGASLALTYLNDKALPHVRPLAELVDAEILMPLDVEQPDAMEAVFDRISTRWEKLDFVVHSIAFAPKADLQGRVTDCSRDGFMRAMDVSCHSFIRMARLAEPLMTDGGTLITMSYHGADEVVQNYGLMGPVKAALQSATRYIAAELGPLGIRVHAISPGPLATRAASGIAHFDQLMQDATDRSALQRLVDIDDVGSLAAYLVSDGARALTGGTMHVDAGHSIIS